MSNMYTLVSPGGEDGSDILVMCDVVIKGDDTYPVFRDITYCQPIYFDKFDLEYLFGKGDLMKFNIWSYEDIESAIEHMD